MRVKTFHLLFFGVVVMILPAQYKAQSATTFTAVNAEISDTLISGGVIKAECIHASDTIKAQSINVAGNLSLAGSLIFEPTNVVGFKYIPANTVNNPFPVISFGKASNQPLPHAPICPTPGNYSNAWVLNSGGGFMSHYSNGPINGALKLSVQHWNGWGQIEVEGTNEVGADANGLAINYFCGRETHINTNSALPNEGGWVRMGGKVSMQKHLEIGDPTSGIINSPSNEALKIHVNDGKGLVLKTWNGSIKLISVDYANSPPGKSPFTVYGDGKTVIGYSVVAGSHSNAMLQVAGKAASLSFYVLKPTTWMDVVFTKDYSLMPLNEVEKYVTKHKHLPGIESEKMILEEGYDINEMDAKLLEKIENLYLYIIKQQEEIDQLKKDLKNLK